MIKINGTHGEGGGAMLRFALALSVLTKKPFQMNNIRSNRPKKGLKHEHLGVINIMKKLCDAKVSDAYLESEEITFIPGIIKSKKIEYEFSTAASCTLVSQSLILASLFSKKKINFKLIGGTDVKWSIPSDYLKNVFIPLLEESGLGKIDFKILKRGYFPKGQGEIQLTISSNYSIEEENIPKINLLNRGRAKHIFIYCNSSLELEEARVCQRAIDEAKQKLQTFLKLKNEELSEEFEGTEVTSDMSYSKTTSTGTIITSWCKFQNSIMGADSLGEKGKKSETMGQEVASKLITLMNSKAVVDEYLADQLIPYLAICKGSFKTNKISKHLKSNIYICQQFLDVLFEIDEEQGIIKID